jgi:hypothetical protein
MRVRTAPFILVLAVLASSCSHKSKARSTRPAMTADGQKLYAVMVDFTAFYLSGPQQASGPDKHLPKNTLMTVIKPSFGYSKVKLDANGQEGYVSTADIHTAPADLAATVRASPSPSPSAATLPDTTAPRDSPSPSANATTPTPRESPSPTPEATAPPESSSPTPEATSTPRNSFFPIFSPAPSESPVTEPTALPSPGSGN